MHLSFPANQRSRGPYNEYREKSMDILAYDIDIVACTYFIWNSLSKYKRSLLPQLSWDYVNRKLESFQYFVQPISRL